MAFCASRSGRGGCAMARALLTISVMVLALALGWAAAEAEPVKPSGGGSPPTVTLRTVIVGTCQEVQRYAESVLGTSVVRSTAEVHTQKKQLLLPAPGSCFTLISFL